MSLSTFIQCMARRFAGPQAPEGSVPAAAAKASSADDHQREAISVITTHPIHRALDRAMELGLYEHADRIVQSALRLGERMTAQLIERIARLHLIQGRPEEALHVIENGRDETSSLRMLRIVCQVLVGQRLEAHIELHRWSRQNACPLEARCLLALLDIEAGHVDDAQRELLKNIRQLADPQSIELMVILSAGRGRRDLAVDWAQRLVRGIQSRDAAISPRLLAESLDLPINTAIIASEHDIESLAVELPVNEPLIPVLVTAQELEPEPGVVRLLYQAIERALPELARRDAAFESLVRLALVLDERELAITWVEAAIDENRITAAMAQLARGLIGETDRVRITRPLESHDQDSVIGRVHDLRPESDGTAHREREDDEGQWKRAA